MEMLVPILSQSLDRKGRESDRSLSGSLISLWISLLNWDPDPT